MEKKLFPLSSYSSFKREDFFDWISYDHSLIWPQDIWLRTFDRRTINRNGHLTAEGGNDSWPQGIFDRTRSMWHLTAWRLTASDICGQMSLQSNVLGSNVPPSNVTCGQVFLILVTHQKSRGQISLRSNVPRSNVPRSNVTGGQRSHG